MPRSETVTLEPVKHADSRAHNVSAADEEATANALEEVLEWEEWGGRGSFVHHMIAGSAAGVVEHTAMFPVDTFKVGGVPHASRAGERPVAHTPPRAPRADAHTDVFCAARGRRRRRQGGAAPDALVCRHG